MDLPINYDKASQANKKKARLAYIDLQEGLCWFCKTSLDKEPSQEVLSKPINLRLFPKGMLNTPVHLHHDHNTGLTIGAVHSRCNAYLWQYKGE